jgi:hypothetical protein
MRIPSLVLNWDHTGIKYVPVGNWTKGSDIVGMHDKRQITAVFGCTMEGEFLPPQIIYGGKTVRCLPLVKFPDSWDITYSPNHWANEETMKRKIFWSHLSNRSVVPYILALNILLLCCLTDSKVSAHQMYCPSSTRTTFSLWLYLRIVLIASSH